MDQVDIVGVLVGSIPVGVFSLAAVWLTQRSAERQRSRERQDAELARHEEMARELLDAVAVLQVALRESVPRWNSWLPKLATLGLMGLELNADRSAGRIAYGMAHVGRIAVDHQQRELVEVDRFRVPLERVMAASTRVALLEKGELREAGLRLSAAASAAVQAYEGNALWRPTAVEARRARADGDVLEAVTELLRAVDTHRQAVQPQRPVKRVRWWRRDARKTRLDSRQQNAATSPAATAAAIDPGIPKRI